MDGYKQQQKGIKIKSKTIACRGNAKFNGNMSQKYLTIGIFVNYIF